MKLVASLLCLVLLYASTFAHEYWLEPESFFLRPNQKTPVHLYVGDGLIKDREERPFQLDKTVMFELFSAAQSLDLKPAIVDGAWPVHDFSADRAGNYLLAMERNWSYITLKPGEFEAYLRSDGMEYIIAERIKLRERSSDGRERYARFIKPLLQVGDVKDETYKKIVGQKLEIIPLDNPYVRKVGDKLQFQILFDGKPLANRVVFADNRNSTTQRLTTDRKGKVTVQMNRAGLWLIRLVVMQRCTSNCNQADWESFWAALTFAVK